jgi:hypothetical protein
MKSTDRRSKRDTHALDSNGMILCNPRDREAAHRARVGDVATADLQSVTCAKCLKLSHRSLREGRRGERGARTPS